MEDKKKIVSLVVLVVVALLFMLWLAGLLHFGKISPGTVAVKAPPIQGEILTVTEVEIPQELTVTGTVVSKTLAQVSAQVPGRVSRVLVEAGARVKKGEPLVTLEAQEYQAKVSQAQGGAAQARAHLTQAAANYQRYKYLYSQGAASPQEFEAMEASFKAAQAAVAQAQAQVQEAATMKGYTVVAAPRAGVVAARKAAVGDLAQPGQPLISLYDPKELQIEGLVNDDYRRFVHVGLPVKVEVPAFPWESQLPLAEIFPISETGSRTFKVRTAVIGGMGTARRAPTETQEKGEGSAMAAQSSSSLHPALAPGMFARMYIPLGKTSGYLIPKAAVRQVGQLAMVEAVVEGRPSLRQVKLGRTMGSEVEVLAGLKAGDRVVIPPESK